MSRIDETRPFIAVRIAVLTVSDTRSLAEDKSGDLLASRLIEAGHTLAVRLHVALLEVRGEAVEVLVVRQDRVRLRAEEVAIPHAERRPARSWHGTP